MEQPRILLIGRIGQVGWELRCTLAPLGQLTCVDYPEINLLEGNSIRKWVRDTAPAVTANAAAYTAVDKAETEDDPAKKINGVAPGILAEEARKLGALLVHYSTDYVYDGTKREPYVESDPTNPLNAYGRTKLAGDEAIQRVNGNYLIFRLCWVYGARGQNFLRTIMRLAGERDQLRVVGDQIGSPTWSRMIAEATTLALKQVLGVPDAAAFKGVYHLCASGFTDWHQFASRIVERMPPAERKCKTIEAITTAEYPTPAKRPAYSVMSCEKLRLTFDLRLPDWEESLNQVLESP